jgi:hypothetical protein
MTTLEQTKGKIKLIGKVAGISNENAHRQGYTQNDKLFKAISFFVETSKVNRVKVELFGMEKDYVYAYSQKEKKTKQIEWTKRHDDHGDYKVLGVALKLEKGEDGKYIRKVLTELDAVEYIESHLKDGDVVRIGGEIDFYEYENQQGDLVQAKRFVIRSITKLDEELDFDAEDFKEESKFEQEIVATETMIDEESKKLIVGAKIIKYDGSHVDTTFTVDTEKYPKLAKNMAKRLSFGDFIKVYGLIINSVVLEEAPEEDIVDDEDDWGGDDEIKKDFETSYIRNYIQELQITSVDSSSYEQKKYKEEDFINEEEDIFNGDFDEDENDDFSDEDGEEIDDLPFA